MARSPSPRRRAVHPRSPVSPNSSSRAARKSRDTTFASRSCVACPRPHSPILTHSFVAFVRRERESLSVGNEKKSSRLNEINGSAAMPIEVIRRERVEKGCDPAPTLFFSLSSPNVPSSNNISVKSRICASHSRIRGSCDIQGFVKFRSAMLEPQKIKATGVGRVMDRFYRSDSRARASNSRFVGGGGGGVTPWMLESSVKATIRGI